VSELLGVNVDLTVNEVAESVMHRVKHMTEDVLHPATPQVTAAQMQLREEALRQARLGLRRPTQGEADERDRETHNRGINLG
jgi:hypothetical protein